MWICTVIKAMKNCLPVIVCKHQKHLKIKRFLFYKPVNFNQIFSLHRSGLSYLKYD